MSKRELRKHIRGLKRVLKEVQKLQKKYMRQKMFVTSLAEMSDDLNAQIAACLASLNE